MSHPGESVDRELRCVECGCNLTGQPKAGRCPVCGASIGDSLPPVMLKESDPDWIRSLCRGTNWMIVAIAFHFMILLYVGGATGRVIDANPHQFAQGKPITFPAWQMMVIAVLMALQSIILCVAVWELTAREPGTLRPNAAREGTRWILLSAYGLGTISTAVYLLQTEDTTALANCMNTFSLLLSVIGSLTMLSYLRELARRLPDEKLAGQATAIQWATPLAIGIAIIAVMSMLSSAPHPGRPGGGVPWLSLIALMVAGLAMLVLGIWWVLLILRFSSWFATAHKMAVYHAHNAKTVRY